MRPQRQRRTTAQNGPVAARFGLADWLALVWARTVAVNRGRAGPVCGRNGGLFRMAG